MIQKPLKASDVAANNNKNIENDVATATAVLTIIEDVVPRMNSLVDENIATISESFSNIAAASKKLAKIVAAANVDSQGLTEEIEKNIGMAIMGMQFQDRLSQNLVIIKNISTDMNNCLKDAINLQSKQNATVSNAINIDLSKKILEDLRLGEVKEIFLSYLLQAGLIKDVAEVGHSVLAENKPQEDEIELF